MNDRAAVHEGSSSTKCLDIQFEAYKILLNEESEGEESDNIAVLNSYLILFKENVSLINQLAF